jgi:hypothetical protein
MRDPPWRTLAVEGPQAETAHDVAAISPATARSQKHLSSVHRIAKHDGKILGKATGLKTQSSPGSDRGIELHDRLCAAPIKPVAIVILLGLAWCSARVRHPTAPAPRRPAQRATWVRTPCPSIWSNTRPTNRIARSSRSCASSSMMAGRPCRGSSLAGPPTTTVPELSTVTNAWYCRSAI